MYGVFLYMGVSALQGMQFIKRIMIMFMPAKDRPDNMILRHVKIIRVHLFTFLQIVCVGILFSISPVYSSLIFKSHPEHIKWMIYLFPVMVLCTCFARKGMDIIFRMDELTWLDNQNLEDEMMKQEDSGDDQSTDRKLNPTGNISWYLKHDKTFTGLSKEDIVNDFPVEFLRNCRSQSTI
ncbi:anion exchange protein 4-like [Mytilus edulis]|uniref:anion exchange protein 4-like n=1 Tax=Mytilus edulis TaxID=6550 RepID=UPI0039F12AD6